MKYVGSFELATESQACPLCRGTSFKVLAHQDRYLMGLSTVGCQRCGLVQTNPRPNAQALDAFYRLDYRRFYQGATQPDQQYISAHRKDVRLRYTTSFFASEMGLPQDAVILDFGCGEGSLFATMRAAGYTGDFYGVELNAEFGEYASKLGNATVFNEVKSPRPVDLVVINHVLEHLLDPVDMLRRLAAVLSPQGRIYIDVPDAEAYRSINDLHIAHLLHFTERTLRHVAQAAGLSVERVEKHSPPHHPASVRLVARAGGAANREIFQPELEKDAWAAVSRAGRFSNTLRLRLRLRLRLGRIGPLRGASRAARRLFVD